MASFLAASLAMGQGLANFPQTKLGQAGMEFLEIGTSARAEGMGGAVTGIDMGSASMFYNPAGLVNPNGAHGDVFLGRTNWIADIAVNSASASYVTPWVTVGVSGMAVDYGSIPGRQQNAAGTITTTGDVDVSSAAFGLGVAKAVTDKFQVGVTGKFVSEKLGLSVGSTENLLVFDAGTLYRTGLAGSVLSMSVKNFSRQAKHQDSGYDLPMAFRIGVAMDVLNLAGIEGKSQSLVVSTDALHPRDRAEEAILGLEYNFSKMVYLRGAARLGRNYTGDKTDNPAAVSIASLGAGLRYKLGPSDLSANYSWSNMGSLLSSVNRFDVQIGF